MVRFSYGKENFIKAEFSFVFEWGRRRYFYFYSPEELVKLIIWFTYFILNMLKCLNSFRLNFNIRFIERFNTLLQ